MSDLDAVRIAVHQNNINRYRRLLRTKLTDLERDYVERRLAEERQSLEVLLARQSNSRSRVPAGKPRRCLSMGRGVTDDRSVEAATV